MTGSELTRAGAPASYGVTELAQLPRLGGLLAKGATGSVGKRPGGGVRLPEVAYQVADVDTAGEAAHLAAYLRLLGEPASEVLPAGFLHVLAFPLATAVMVRGDFPLPLLGMVHLRNTARVLRSVRLGETLAVRAWAQDARAHRRGVQVDLVAEVLVGGELAYRGVSTYLAKGFTASGGAAPADETSREEWTAPLPTARWRLGGGTGRAYAAVSGDQNPIHTSSLGAKAFGFPRTIAHGMYTAARALAEVGPARRGEKYEWAIEFFKPVLLPSTVDVAIRYADEVSTSSTNGGASTGERGFVYDGWRSGKNTRHFRGTVTPL
ncbi:MaoC like domain-containing protein [Promicromonospora umidemergens]|uniref:MaoC/PaaZ C-terminal domain-containing protein n=1 Tax=Promicromonospora umidemergens TaxID=629679 RepID=A0ABP8XJ69_9MICO|nr:MaoC/PaaZ C-terminal domain-containing protein [Promicromonospora umidemergens]MCP2284816.1 MaoC like domain-containing protein [Promicromonospora umidemergens]